MAHSKLTVRALEERFAALVAKGISQAAAYRIVKPGSKKWPDAAVSQKASTLAARETVRQRIIEISRSQSVQDVLNAGEWMKQTAELLKEARADGNLNAAQALNRQLGQATGALREHVIVNQYDRLDDKTLVERLAKGDEVLAAMLSKAIGSNSFDN